MTKRPERNFYEQLRRNLPKLGVRIDLQRVENVAMNGTPDINYCIDGDEGWAELKAWERIRFSGRFTVPKLREEQAAWMIRRSNVGGRCYLLCRINKDVALFDGRLVPALFDKTLHLEWVDGENIAALWLKPPLNWKLLLDKLRESPVTKAVIDEHLSLFKVRTLG